MKYAELHPELQRIIRRFEQGIYSENTARMLAVEAQMREKLSKEQMEGFEKELVDLRS